MRPGQGACAHLGTHSPGSHAGRALPRPLRARLLDAMDAALLHSLLEANCSLALAEELLLDGWRLQPLDPEGREGRLKASASQRLRLLPGCVPRPVPLGTPSEPHFALFPLSAPFYCNTTLDQIGTCWPRSAAGALVERPCPEYFNGIKYNTTRECPGLLLPR